MKAVPLSPPGCEVHGRGFWGPERSLQRNSWSRGEQPGRGPREELNRGNDHGNLTRRGSTAGLITDRRQAPAQPRGCGPPRPPRVSARGPAHPARTAGCPAMASARPGRGRPGRARRTATGVRGGVRRSAQSERRAVRPGASARPQSPSSVAGTVRRIRLPPVKSHLGRVMRRTPRGRRARARRRSPSRGAGTR